MAAGEESKSCRFVRATRETSLKRCQSMSRTIGRREKKLVCLTDCSSESFSHGPLVGRTACSGNSRENRPSAVRPPLKGESCKIKFVKISSQIVVSLLMRKVLSGRPGRRSCPRRRRRRRRRLLATVNAVRGGRGPAGNAV